MMEQRQEIIKRLNVNRKQSLLLEQEVDGRVIRFRIRKPSSTSDFEDTIPFMKSSPQQQQSIGSEHYPMVDMQPHGGNCASGASSQVAQSPSGPAPSEFGAEQQQQQHTGGSLSEMKPDEVNVRRMHTALTLNEAILKRSKSAKLVIINLPVAPKVSTPEAENNCKLLPIPFHVSLSLCKQCTHLSLSNNPLNRHGVHRDHHRQIGARFARPEWGQRSNNNPLLSFCLRRAGLGSDGIGS